MRNLPPLSGLQAFEAAARHLSFTEAAKELHCTQAAVSQRVRALETFLSRPLFVRRSNGLELTEVGEAYLPGATGALDAAAAATAGLKGRNVPGVVTVSAPLSFLNLWLTPRLGPFLETNGTIQVRLNSAIWTDPNADLADIRIEVRESVELESEAAHLACERLDAVCAPRVAARLGAGGLAAFLMTERRIAVQGKHDAWQRWHNGLGLAPHRGGPELKVDNAVTALEAAAHGLGVAVTYSTYCAPFLASGHVVRLPGGSLETGLCHALTVTPHQPSWHPAHKVTAWLRREFAG